MWCGVRCAGVWRSGWAWATVCYGYGILYFFGALRVLWWLRSQTFEFVGRSRYGVVQTTAGDMGERYYGPGMGTVSDQRVDIVLSSNVPPSGAWAAELGGKGSRGFRRSTGSGTSAVGVMWFSQGEDLCQVKIEW